MSSRPAFLFATAATLGLACPALAQDVRYPDLPPLEEEVEVMVHAQEHDMSAVHNASDQMEAHHSDSHHAEHYPAMPDANHDGEVHGEGHHIGYEGDWDGDWADNRHYQGGWEGTYHADAAGPHGSYRNAGGAPLLAYTAAERDQWLADCRILMADGGGYYDHYYYADRDRNGRLVGGLLGATVGGVIGNRVADGNRLGGTLIGAGLGGLAGVAVGAAVDAASTDGRDSRGYSRDEVWAARYCEAYLRRYELGGGAGFFGQAQPMMIMQVAHAAPQYRQRRRARDCDECRVVTEEVVEIEAEEAPAPRARRVVPRTAPEPGKRIRTN